jgi:5S rRNA maturation endonuclease (ribonuclease M5)
MRTPGRRRRDEERLGELEEAIDRLREVAETGTVVVEGSRDLAALDWLGIGGFHVHVNKGQPLHGLLEDLVQCPPPVVLLVDWDRTGGRLVRTLADNLRSRIALDTDVRRRIAAACHCRALEDVPAELEALRRAGQRPDG